MAFFDLHCHPSMKPAISEPGLDLDAWDDFFIYDGAPGYLEGFRNVVDSQANFSMLQRGGFELVVVPLIGMERSFSRNILLRKKLPKHSPMDDDTLQGILKGRITYLETLNRDFDMLQKSVDTDPTKARILRKGGDFKSGQLNFIIGVEGVHSFKGGFEPDGDEITPQEISHYLTNFRTFRKDKRVFYMTLTHLSRERGANHAYGVRGKVGTGMGTDTEFDDIELTVLGGHRSFKPYKDVVGITDLGHAFIDECYGAGDKENIVLIDIKHLSWQGRQQLYQIRKANQDKHWDKIPLVASHMGVTGTSLKKGEVFVKRVPRRGGKMRTLRFWKKQGLGETYFNPWTINLFDEDIVEILQSNGLIGVSLDQRIVGATKVYKEYINRYELNDLRGDLVRSRRKPPGYTKYNDNIPGISNKDCFINNLLHIIRVGVTSGFDGKNGNPNVWDHVCIGSDLDGLIDPLDLYDSRQGVQVTAENFEELVKYMEVRIPQMCQSDRVLSGQMNDLDKKLEKILFLNGKNFVEKFLDHSMYPW